MIENQITKPTGHNYCNYKYNYQYEQHRLLDEMTKSKYNNYQIACKMKTNGHKIAAIDNHNS